MWQDKPFEPPYTENRTYGGVAGKAGDRPPMPIDRSKDREKLKAES